MFELNDKCTYWPRIGAYNTYGSPVVLDCKWESRQQLVRTSTGEEKTSGARIYLREAVGLNGKVYHGVSTSATPPSGSLVILAQEEAKSSLFDLMLVKLYV